MGQSHPKVALFCVFVYIDCRSVNYVLQRVVPGSIPFSATEEQIKVPGKKKGACGERPGYCMPTV
jgi:hypothetical protein